MRLGTPIPFVIDSRYYELNRPSAIKNVFDALVEIITNCDDSYHRLWKKGKIQKDGGPILIEVCHRRGSGKKSLLIIRDQAEGLTLENMIKKFVEVGVRQSESGDRGFMSRGLRDCTELGDVKITSVVDDRLYEARLTSRSQLLPDVDGEKVTKEIRESLNIGKDNGTVIEIEVTRHIGLPRISKIKAELPWHYALRDILDENSQSEVFIKEYGTKEKPQPVIFRKPEGIQILDTKYSIVGYPQAEARLIIWKAAESLEDFSNSMRRSGFIIKGKRGIHECSLLRQSFENDVYARKYFGRIECEHIDDLLNEYDERRKTEVAQTLENPCLLIDANRQGGLHRQHPFTDNLLEFPVNTLKELIDKDRSAAETNDALAESKEMRKMLDDLAKAASKFILDQTDDISDSSLDNEVDDNAFANRGAVIIPTYAKIAVGEVRDFGIYINKKMLSTNSAELTIHCDNPALEPVELICKVSPHKKKLDMLYGRFRLRGMSVRDSIYVEARDDNGFKTDALVNVVEDRIEERIFNTPLEFECHQYQIRDGSTKSLKIFAKFPDTVLKETEITVESDDSANLPIKGRCYLSPIEGSNYALGEVKVEARLLCQRSITLKAYLGDLIAETSVKIVQKEESGPRLEFILVNKDFGPLRAQWATHENKPNLLEISMKHEVVERYLGPNQEGEKLPHMRAVIAEIIAESVCRKSLALEAKSQGWQFGFAAEKEDNLIIESVLNQLNKRMKKFLPIAHEIMLKDRDIKKLLEIETVDGGAVEFNMSDNKTPNKIDAKIISEKVPNFNELVSKTKRASVEDVDFLSFCNLKDNKKKMTPDFIKNVVSKILTAEPSKGKDLLPRDALRILGYTCRKKDRRKLERKIMKEVSTLIDVGYIKEYSTNKRKRLKLAKQ